MPPINFPPGMPEDQKAFVQAAIERQLMLQTDYHNRLARFWDEMSLDSLQMLSGLLARGITEPQFIAWLEGHVDALITFKFKVCPGCGLSHEDNLEAALAAHTGKPIDLSVMGQDPDGTFNMGIDTATPVFAQPSAPMDDAALAAAWNGPDSEAQPDPERPGFTIAGDRMASCETCNGDMALKICDHPTGTHGQLSGAGGCPEPMSVPCPDCTCPGWYVNKYGLEASLAKSPCHPNATEDGQPCLIPVETPDRGVCSTCGQEWVYSEFLQ